MNGTTLQEGRLEICINSNWSTICDDMWDDTDARVVCRQLGYDENGKSANSSETSLAFYHSTVHLLFLILFVAGRAIYRAYFGQGVGRIALDNVNCAGGESVLSVDIVDYLCIIVNTMKTLVCNAS